MLTQCASNQVMPTVFSIVTYPPKKKNPARLRVALARMSEGGIGVRGVYIKYILFIHYEHAHDILSCRLLESRQVLGALFT
jgi:hypothetical protein